MSADQAKERKGQTSIAPLLRFMEGLELSIELKNGRVYRGTLRSADAFMNLVLHRVQRRPGFQEATPVDSAHSLDDAGDSASSCAPQISASTHWHPITPGSSNKEELTLEEYDLVHIRGPCIRYIHFPDAADIPALIKAGQNRERAAADRYQRGKRKAPS